MKVVAYTQCNISLLYTADIAGVRNNFFCKTQLPRPSSRQRLSNDDFLEDNREDYQNCSVLY